MIRSLMAVLRRDLTLAVRGGGAVGLSLVFFLGVVVLLPFAIGPDLALLARIGPAILWLGALLATLIGLDRLFQPDLEDGSLDGLLASSTPLSLIVLSKALAHWLCVGLPLAIAAPILGVLLNLPPGLPLWTGFTLLLGTPALTLVGAIGAALTVNLKRGGILVPVLVLPLTIPIVIFGVAATRDESAWTALTMLLAADLIGIVLAPLAAAAALRAAQT